MTTPQEFIDNRLNIKFLLNSLTSLKINIYENTHTI
jgi:hypothetical protein